MLHVRARRDVLLYMAPQRKARYKYRGHVLFGASRFHLRSVVWLHVSADDGEKPRHHDQGHERAKPDGPADHHDNEAELANQEAHHGDVESH